MDNIKGIGPTAGIIDHMFESSNDPSVHAFFKQRKKLELIADRIKSCLHEMYHTGQNSEFEDIIEIRNLAIELHIEAAKDDEIKMAIKRERTSEVFRKMADHGILIN